ncbi:ArdC-like ssDNA-binding domain-containing protein [Corynebacterium suicordis]|nr:ArdC-like ssDNA-binding domain-containing protein [Corynebacterium suicordis]MDR6278620.1 antirestriction protein ArdC [Corynebacterium suicordis]
MEDIMALSAAARKKQAEKRQELAKELQASITEQVEQLVKSDEWIDFLNFAQQFHAYSVKNLLLIRSQFPTATQVAGYRKWANEFGRQVRKGERGIKIFGYSTKKYTVENEHGEEEEHQRRTFPILTVFDISQTEPTEEAVEIPEIARRLEGSDDSDIYARAQEFAESKGYTVTRESIPGQTNGYITQDGSFSIVVDSSLGDAQAAKTLLHECAHMILHSDNGTRADLDLSHEAREIEAESVAYVVAGILGLDTSAYTVGYVAGWAGGSVEAIQDTAGRVLKGAHELAEALEHSAKLQS